MQRLPVEVSVLAFLAAAALTACGETGDGPGAMDADGEYFIAATVNGEPYRLALDVKGEVANPTSPNPRVGVEARLQDGFAWTIGFYYVLYDAELGPGSFHCDDGGAAALVGVHMPSGRGYTHAGGGCTIEVVELGDVIRGSFVATVATGTTETSVTDGAFYAPLAQ
jgi:hypothetical protein